jgi:hypothetical protein
VRSANPSGLVLPIAKTGAVCDVNSSFDTTDLLDDSFGDDFWDLPGDEMFDILLDGMLTDFPLLDLEPLDLPPLDPLPLSFPSSGTQVNPDSLIPKPDPSARTFDLMWEQLLEGSASEFVNGNGNRIGELKPWGIQWGYKPYQIDDIHTWVYVETGSKKYSPAEEFETIKPYYAIGIVGINYNEKENPGINGYKPKEGGYYASGGHQAGPFASGYGTGFGTFFYRVQVRNVYQRWRGSMIWEPVDNIVGVDGDQFYPENPR